MPGQRSKPNKENEVAEGTKGTLTSLKMIEVSDEELNSARGGRGHGEYDTFLDLFLASDLRGTEVGYEGVKSNSVKTGMKSAVDRAVKAGKISEGVVQVRGKDDHVYVVKSQAAADES